MTGLSQFDELFMTGKARFDNTPYKINTNIALQMADKGVEYVGFHPDFLRKLTTW